MIQNESNNIIDRNFPSISDNFLYSLDAFDLISFQQVTNSGNIV